MKIFSFVACIIFLLAVPIRLIGKDCLQFYNLEKTGIETKAKVLSLEPQNHQFIDYSYVVQSVEYRGIGRADFGNPGFNSLTPGMELRAFYLPKTPAISCLGVPHELLMNDLIPGVLIMLIFPIFIWFACFNMRR